jgi:hypothetical protein
MLINESTLRKIIREEMANIDRGQRLITQDDVDEQELGGGYSVEFGDIPGATNEDDDDFQKIRLARMRASGASDADAKKMASRPPTFRGQRPGSG